MMAELDPWYRYDIDTNGKEGWKSIEAFAEYRLSIAQRPAREANVEQEPQGQHNKSKSDKKRRRIFFMHASESLRKHFARVGFKTTFCSYISILGGSNGWSCRKMLDTACRRSTRKTGRSIIYYATKHSINSYPTWIGRTHSGTRISSLARRNALQPIYAIRLVGLISR
jgi:hypothetical protein